MHAALQRSFERRDGVAHRLGERHVEVDQDQGAPQAGAQRGELAAVPRRDNGRIGLAAQVRNQARALAIDRGGRASQEDDEGRRATEVTFGKRLSLSRDGAGDGQRGRLQLSLHADSQHTQRQAAGENDGKAQGGPAKAQQPSPPMAAILR